MSYRVRRAIAKNFNSLFFEKSPYIAPMDGLIIETPKQKTMLDADREILQILAYATFCNIFFKPKHCNHMHMTQFTIPDL